MKELNLEPKADNLMESTRSIGYSLPSAVADLIDNSISANSKNIRIQFPRINHEYLTILDDGIGMDLTTLTSAMRYGSSPLGCNRKSNDLGRFGLGLKMASLSQCRKLTVASKDSNGCLSIACWDLDYIKQSGKWSLLILDLDDIIHIKEIQNLQQQKTGTLIIWENLDLMLQDCNNDVDSDLLKKKLVEIESHLSLVFHRFLKYYPNLENSAEIDDVKNSLISIFCNGTELEPIDPFLSDDSKTVFPRETPPIGNGSDIFITPWLLPYPSSIAESTLKKIGDLQQYQGFYIYRNRRLVIRGSWFYLTAKTELSRLIRVQVDIPNYSSIDKEWRLDVKKSSATLPTSLKKYLKNTVDKLCVRSKRTFTKRARCECTDTSMWIRVEDEYKNISYSINREYSYVKRMIEKYPEVKKLLKLIELTLPYDSIYADKADQSNIEKPELEMDVLNKILNVLTPTEAKALKEMIHD